MGHDTLKNTRGTRDLALTLLYSTCFFGFFYLAGFFDLSGGSLWYPAAGARMAALLLFGGRAIPALAAAELLAVGIYGWLNPESGFGQLRRLLNVGLTPMIYGLGTWLWIRFTGLDIRLRHLRDVALLSAAALVVPLMAAAKTALVEIGPSAGSAQLLSLTIVFWIGDTIGVLMLTPLLLTGHQVWRDGRYKRWTHLDAAHLGIDFVVVWATLVVLHGLPRWIENMDTQVHWYVAFLPVIWISFRHGLIGSFMGILAMTTGVAWFFDPSFEATRFRELQIFLIILAVTSLMMGSVVSTLRERNRKLHEIELRLEADNRQLEIRHGEMERFSYTASHDLKSPLVTIQGFAKYAKQDLESGQVDRTQDDLDRIVTAAGAMERLINELLEFSRVGPAEHRQAQLSLAEVAREAVTLVAGRLDQRGVQVHVSADLPTVMGDRLRLLQVMQNLIDNAVKFIGDQPNPRIDVGTRQDGDQILFFVQDNGVGIEPKDQKKIFGLFDRLDSDQDGTGVGLALVKRVIDEHGGQIWVESEGRGQGTAFCFTLAGVAS